jgi:HTH-type transcriptional regulator / antitoxin HigA
MKTAALNEAKYRKLLDHTLPVAIHTEAEYRRLLEAARILMETPDSKLSEEEGRLLEMLGILIEEYEDRVHPLPKSTPAKMLKHCLYEEGLTPADLASILPKSRVSEILNGKREISKSQAKALAEFFRVPVDLFL